MLCGDITRLPERLRPVVTEVRTAIGDGEIDSIEFWYVHNRPESQQVGDELRTVESTIRNSLRDGFDPSKIPQEIAAIEVGMGRQEEWYRSLSAPILVSDSISFDVPGYFLVTGDQWKAIVTAIPARRLRELYETHRSNLFSANYRDYLGASRSRKRDDINRFIRDTAEEEPGKFWVFNNGVSAIVHGFEVEEVANGGATLVVQGLSIVNGAQTTGSIGSLPRPPDERAMVPFRFIHCTDGDTIADIVRYNNSQNPLMPADYKSNDEVQRRLREEFTKIPKSKYTGGRRGMPVDRVAPPGELMPTDTCAQALAAFHQRPDIAYHQKATIWQDDAIYREFFCEKTTACHIVFAYSLLKCIEERKKALRNQERHEGDLPGDLKTQQEFFSRRGSSLLLASAIARSLETVLSRSIPSWWSLGFRSNVGPVEGIGCWAPIVEALLPQCIHLRSAAENSIRDRTQIRHDIDQFCAVASSIKTVLRPVFETFAERVARN